MKKFIALACATLMSASTVMHAEDFNQIGLAYNLDMYNYSYKGGYEPDPINASGVAIKYIHGFGVSNSLPMFVETGLNLSFGFGSNDADEKGNVAQKTQFASLAVPVNFSYKFGINDSFTIKPYLGINLKLNVLGRFKQEYTDGFYEDFEKESGMTYEEFLENYEQATGEPYDDGMGEWTNLYSSKARGGMGDKESTWNRFQLGWHIGVDLEFNKFVVGLNYGTDFIPAWKLKKNKVNSSTFNIGIGFNF